MRETHVGSELKAAAQDVLHLGARYVKAGRAWLSDRREEMASRSDESGREEATYGRSGNPQERQQSDEQNRPWRESQGYQQGQGQQYGRGPGTQQGGQGLGQRGSGAQGFGEFGERSQGWESERGADFYGGQSVGQRGQSFNQGSLGYGPNVQGHGQGSERYGQSGQGFGQGSEGYGQGGQSFGQGSEGYGQSGQAYGQGSERYGQGSQGYGHGGQQQDWQRGMQQRLQGEQHGSQGYGMVQGGRQGLGVGGMSGGYGGMSGGYGGQQPGYGSGLGQRSFRGVGPKNYTRSDERIREDVCERLTQDDDLDASELEIRAEQGVVTLEGKVEERWMKHRAEDIAESCSGVREVENRIRVESGLGKGRGGSESLGRSGSRDESRTQSGGTSGSTPH